MVPQTLGTGDPGKVSLGDAKDIRVDIEREYVMVVRNK
jgi:hypothetical protein